MNWNPLTWFKPKPPGVKVCDIYVREQGQNVWPITRAEIEYSHQVDGTVTAGIPIRTEADWSEVIAATKAGKCFRGFEAKELEALRSGKNLKMDWAKLKEHLRDA